MESPQHQLEYHVRGERSPLPWKKWLAWISAALLIAAAGLVGVKAFSRFRLLWIQQQCLLYEGQSTMAIYDSRPSALASLHSSGNGWTSGAFYLYPAATSNIPYVAFTPPELQRFDIFSPNATAFLHLRMSPCGNQRLVVVSVSPGYGLEYQVIRPASLAVNPIRLWFYRGPIYDAAGMESFARKGVAVFAGQFDRAHADHFTVPFEVSGEPFAVEGWLRDDDSLRLVEHRLTPASQPSPASSH